MTATGTFRPIDDLAAPTRDLFHQMTQRSGIRGRTYYPGALTVKLSA